MIIPVISLIVCMELLMFFHLSRKVEVFSPLLIIIALPVFYANSLFFDYLLFDYNEIFIPAMGFGVNVNSFNYLSVVLITFIYLVSCYIMSLKLNFDGLFYKHKCLDGIEGGKENDYKMKLVGFISICILICFILITLGMDRYEIKKLYSPIISLLLQTAFFISCIYIILIEKIKKYEFMYIIILLLYSILIFEREPLVFLLYTLFLRSSVKKISFKYYFISALLLLTLMFYKTIMWWLLSIITGEDASLAYFISQQYEVHKGMLTRIDPAASILLLSDFINGENSSLYSSYYGSYVTNIFMQFLRMFNLIEWNSLGEYVGEYYTNGQMGTAFSMMLESLINFWLLSVRVFKLMVFDISIK